MFSNSYSWIVGQTTDFRRHISADMGAGITDPVERLYQIHDVMKIAPLLKFSIPSKNQSYQNYLYQLVVKQYSIPFVAIY